ncbi:IclR family transcriptional regulator [Sneathiella limimaris]|uniref:IclR family transcriptional regulator n=1 Tax=Sneathiella limimaris TaxID=1964213 RepID=UPI00146EDE50|nr:IclR family transcriptional regulator [Sneathiella limimaris]
MSAAPKTDATRTGQVQSLNRALSILNTVAESNSGLKLTEISKTLGLAPSTTHRLLTTLQEERYVQYDRDSSRWQIGIQAFVTGNGFLISRDLVTVARPHMRRLMEESGETVNLAISEGDDVIYMAQIESREMMRVYSKPGNRVPLHCSGVGKAILMMASDEEIARRALENGLNQLTDKTISSVEALTKELNESRKRGFAIDDEEHAVGLRCVASVIFDEYAEPFAAVSISGPAARVQPERLMELGEQVKAVSRQITAALGGKIPATA